MNESWMVLETIAMLLKQGYAIQEVISICKYLTNNKMIQRIENHLLVGEDLRNSILKAKIPKQFQEFFYFFSMHREVSEAIIDSLKICKEQSMLFKRLKKQLLYPVFLLVFLFFFSIFVTVFLMPEVQKLFVAFSITPSFLFSITFFILKGIPIIFIVIFIVSVSGIIMCCYVVKKQRYPYIDFLILRIPFISRYIKKYYSLKFAMYYQELLRAGYDTTHIITILTKQMMDTDIKMLVYEIQQEIKQGKDLLVTIKEFDYFEELLAKYFLLFMENKDKATVLNEYIEINIRIVKTKIEKVIKIVIPSIYGFVILFVVMVYLCIILPMMDIVNLM